MDNFFKKVYPIAIGVVIAAVLSSMITFIGTTVYYSESIARFKSVESVLDNYYYEEYDKDKAMDSAIDGYVSSLGDPYTEYMSAEELAEFNELMNSSYCGIGVTVQNDIERNIILVIDVFENSPAAEAGIQPGDAIIKVNGTSYTGEQLEEATNNIQGEEGTEVVVTVLKKDAVNEVDLKIVRRSIIIDTVASEIIDGNIGYIAISQFANNTAEEFSTQLDELMAKNITGLIVDVRDNGGGLTTAVEAVADCLLPKGAVIYYTADKSGDKEYFTSKMDGVDLPVVILANENSASASEILVGALKDNDRATVVGTKTFGKGVVQQLIPLDEETAVKVTVERYFTPNGDYIHDKGIEPDYKVELGEDTDTQLEKAVEILKN